MAASGDARSRLAAAALAACACVPPAALAGGRPDEAAAFAAVEAHVARSTPVHGGRVLYYDEQAGAAVAGLFEELVPGARPVGKKGVAVRFTVQTGELSWRTVEATVGPDAAGALAVQRLRAAPPWVKTEKGFRALEQPAELPEFRWRTLDDELLTPELLKGGSAILYFWLSFCGDCQRQLPELEKLHKEYPLGDPRVIGLAMHQDEADTRRIAAENHFTFAIAHLGPEPDSGFWPETFGRLYIVDKDGRIVRELEGVHTSEQLAELLRALP